jgi:DNA-binding SARP family transcriptional activator
LGDFSATVEGCAVSLSSDADAWLRPVPERPSRVLMEVETLIRAGAYDDLKRLLESRRGMEAGDAMTAVILNAVHQLCLICIQLQKQQDSQREALRQANRLENDTRRRMGQLLEAIQRADARDPDSPAELGAADSRAMIEAEGATSLISGWLTSLRSRIEGVFGARPDDPSPWPEDAGEESPGELALTVAAGLSLPPSAPEPDAPEAQLQPVGTPVAIRPSPAIPDAYSGPPATPHDLHVYCLGAFRVYAGGQLVDNWPSRKGKSILKYLLLHRRHLVSKEILMETFWPDSDPEAARNNLNVAIYGLRRALRNAFPGGSHVVFQDESYQLNPDMVVWVDVEEFQKLLNAAKLAVQRGSILQAVHEFEAVAAYYQGELLAEDRYEEWLLPIRQQLHDDHLNALDYLSNFYYEQNDYRACIAVCRDMLTIEPAYEAIHRRLMCIYAHQNQHYLAIRQYQHCVEKLDSELNVEPDPETTRLFETILRRDQSTANDVTSP